MIILIMIIMMIMIIMITKNNDTTNNNGNNNKDKFPSQGFPDEAFGLRFLPGSTTSIEASLMRPYVGKLVANPPDPRCNV